MPVRLLHSAVFKWPDRVTVLSAAREWALQLKARDPNVAHVWCIGSYARGDWGVGSDLDLVVILGESSLDRFERYDTYLPPGQPVPVDLWVYTAAEWQAMAEHSPNLWRHVNDGKIDLLQNRSTESGTPNRTS